MRRESIRHNIRDESPISTLIGLQSLSVTCRDRVGDSFTPAITCAELKGRSENIDKIVGTAQSYFRGNTITMGHSNRLSCGDNTTS
jgi:hypothetical protein